MVLIFFIVFRNIFFLKKLDFGFRGESRGIRYVVRWKLIILVLILVMIDFKVVSEGV